MPLALPTSRPSRTGSRLEAARGHSGGSGLQLRDWWSRAWPIRHEWCYDVRGNLTSLAPPGRPAHVFHYTLLDQEQEYEPPAVEPGDPRTLFTFDFDGLLTQVDRPDGASVVLGYDGAGRLATLTTPRGITTQTYDPISGNVATITAPDSEGLGFGYDGSLVTSTTWSGTIAGSVSQAYDSDFRVVTQSVNGGFSKSFGYDADGLLTQAGAETLTRDPQNGLLTGTTLGTITTGQAYTGFGELASDAATAGATALYSNSYTRDALGRITQKVETIGDVATTLDYGFDLAGRLETVHTNGILTASYAFDANGNRLSRTAPPPARRRGPTTIRTGCCEVPPLTGPFNLQVRLRTPWA